MAKKNKSVRRRRKRRVLFGIELFVLLILVGGLFIYAKVNEKMNKLDIDTSSDEASKVEVNEAVVGSKTLKGFTNIALFGVDNRKEDVKSGQSDTTIIASINNDTKEVKLVSLYRDTHLNIGNDKYTKCNAAYNNGGPTQAMSMINTNLDLNITNYVAVNFKALATAIDCLGGLDVEMTYVELKNMNDYCVETSEVTGMDYEPIEMPEYPGDDKQESEILGSFHLNGVQATSYCRIRYTSGWDMRRTERQRYIISLIVEKAKKASLSTLNDIMDQVFPMIATDFSKSELIKLGMGILSYKLGETSGFPNSSLMGDEVKNAIGLDCVVPTTLETNVKALHQFLFGDQAYEPSDIVKQRSDYIAGHTGFGNSYVSDEQKALISDRASTYDGSADTQSSSGTSTYSDTDDSDYSDYSDYSDSGSSDYSSGGSSDYSDSGSSDYNDSGSSDYGDSGSSDYNSGDDYNDSGDSGESGNNYDNGYEGSGDDGSGGSSSGESGDGGGYNNEDDDYSE